jgi:hypothetical protein
LRLPIPLRLPSTESISGSHEKHGH